MVERHASSTEFAGVADANVVFATLLQCVCLMLTPEVPMAVAHMKLHVSNITNPLPANTTMTLQLVNEALMRHDKCEPAILESLQQVIALGYRHNGFSLHNL